MNAMNVPSRTACTMRLYLASSNELLLSTHLVAFVNRVFLFGLVLIAFMWALVICAVVKTRESFPTVADWCFRELPASLPLNP